MAPKKEVAAARAAAIEAAAQRVVAVETNPEEPTLEKKVSDLQTATRDAVERLDVVDERLDELENKGDRIQEEIQGFDNDPSAGSPTETLLRLLLPLNDKVQWTSRDVAGSEPPTSPRSEHFTGPFNRAGGTTRPIKARSASPAVGTSRPVLTVRRTGRPTPRSNYELFNCNNLNIRYWSWNYRGCWHQTCPPMDPR
ncbi:hypothetical protein V6N13_089182 [Hibiscus sabdariffa]